jgi:hypothetical protein
MYKLLTFKAWRERAWYWLSIRRLLRKYPPDRKVILRGQINQLINQLVHNHIFPYLTLGRGLPAAAGALDAGQLRMGLDLAIKSADRKIDPAALLQRGLLTAARSLDGAQFYAAVDFAIRLIERQIDPNDALEWAVPLTAKGSPTPAEFRARLEALECFILVGGEQPPLYFIRESSALAKLPSELFCAAIEAGGCLAANGMNPMNFFQALPAAVSGLTEGQLWAGLELTTRFARERINVSESLRFDLPEAAKAVGRPELLAGLEAVSRLAEKKINPGAMLRYGIPAAAAAGVTAADFQINLQALEQFVAAQGQNSHRCQNVLMSLSSTPMTAAQFRASLDFATRLETSSVDARAFILDAGQGFQHALKPALAASSTPEELRANFDSVERFSACAFKHYRNQLSEFLGLMPQAGLNSRQFRAGLEMAGRLAESEVSPASALKHGLPAAARACATTEDFDSSLQSLEAFLLSLAKHPAIHDRSFGDGMQASLVAQTRTEFEAGLEIFGALIARLTERHHPINIAPGPAELARQAVALSKCYEDFEIVLHEAITSEHEYSDPYYSPRTETRVDHPQWLEMLPSGRRLAPLPLAMLDGERIKEMLDKRSWLWRAGSVPSEREKVVEKVVHWRSYLPVFLDRLMRQGIIDPATPLSAVYLIGSYPWIEAPNDIDLFIVVKGARGVAYLSPSALADKGVRLPEMPPPQEPVQQTTQRQAAVGDQTQRAPLGISVEMVGQETLLGAGRGEPVRHAEALAKRYALLYGSVLLCGNDLFQTAPVPLNLLRQLHQDLLSNLERADWPELSGNDVKIAHKKTWRKREADALAKFIEEQLRH